MTHTPGTSGRPQRGGTLLGLILGLLLGLGIALGVALYIAKVPVPFVDKVGRRTPEQDAAEAEKLRHWDPNAALGGKPAASRPEPPPAVPAAPAVPASAPPVPASAPARAASRAPAASPAPVASSPARASGRDPLAILEGGPVITEATKPAPKPAEPVAAGFYVQAGAYSSGADAEQQRARLAMQGFSSKVVEREQNGRSVYRVRLGPYGSREDAQQAQDRLKSAGFDAILSSDRPKP